MKLRFEFKVQDPDTDEDVFYAKASSLESIEQEIGKFERHLIQLKEKYGKKTNAKNK